MNSVNSIIREKVVVVEPATCYRVEGTDELSSEKLFVETVGGLRVAVANVRDLLSSTKFAELEIMAEEENLDIIAITESWSNSQIGDSVQANGAEITFTNYTGLK